MKKIYLLIAVLVTLSFSVTVKVGSIAPQNSPWDDNLKKMASEWKKISGGKVVLKIYPGGVAGDEADMLRKMKTNLLGGVALTGIGMNRLYPGVLAAQLPMMYNSDEEFKYVFDKMAPFFEAELEKRGAKVVIWTQIGWIHYFSKGKVTTPTDMAKEKMFVYAGDGNAVTVWRNAGFNPIPLSLNDVMTGLQSGMITSFATTPLSAAAMQWFGLAPNMADMKWSPLMGGVIISTKVWKKISPEVQKELLASAKKIGEEMQGEIDKSDAQAIEIMKENGLTVNHVPQEKYAEWKKIADIAIQQVLGKTIDKASYEQVKAYIKEYRESNTPTEEVSE